MDDNGRLELSSFRAALSALEVDNGEYPEDITMGEADFEPELVPEPEPEPELQSQPEPEPEPQLELKPQAKAELPLPSSRESHALVLSPSQLGAQHAIHKPVSIDMPLFPPWHQNLPYLLSTYLQLLFNFAVLVIALMAANSLQNDVKRRLQEQGNAILRAASNCATQFVENQCAAVPGRPALRDYCNELEACMERDPDHISRFSVYASVLAEAIEAFFAPLTVRTLALLAVLVAAAIFGTNYLFGFFRAKAYFKLAHPPRQEPERMSMRLTPQQGDIWAN